MPGRFTLGYSREAAAHSVYRIFLSKSEYRALTLAKAGVTLPRTAMRLPLILALTLLPALSLRAEDTARPPGDKAASEQSPPAAPQLLHMERALMQKQEARDGGRLPPEKYQEFVASFRIELDAVMSRIPPTPENKGLHAQILARLGTQEQGQALANLDEALAQDPESPALLVAKGGILYEQRDFQAASVLAQQAWESSGRQDARAWALLKMSEGRISGAQSGEPAPRLKPASDFARLDWSIPQRHDINGTALEFIRQATEAHRAGDAAAAEKHVQQAMNADPTSESLQDFYLKTKADFVKRAETKTYVEHAIAAVKAGRSQEELAWMQKAYDRDPSDQAYEALQVARQRAYEDAARRSAEHPKRAPQRNDLPPWALLTLLGVGTGIAGFGVYQVAKSKDTNTSDDGINPSPKVAPDQARRNYMASAAVAGTALLALVAWEFGPGVLGAGRTLLTTFGPSAPPALVPVGPGAGAGAAVTAEEAIKIGLPAAVGAYGAKKTAEDLYSNAKSQKSGNSTAEPPKGESSSVNAQDSLNRKLRALADAEKRAVKKRILPDNRIRYYEPEKPARTPGPTRGSSLVTEYNPKTGSVRQWYENYDRAGQVNRVHPKMVDGQLVDSMHYPPTGSELP